MNRHWSRAGASHNFRSSDHHRALVQWRFRLSSSGAGLRPYNPNKPPKVLPLRSYLEWRRSKPMTASTLPLARDWLRVIMWPNLKQRKLWEGRLKAGWASEEDFPSWWKIRESKELFLLYPMPCKEMSSWAVAAILWQRGTHLRIKAYPPRMGRTGPSLSHQNPKTRTARYSC